VAPFKREKEETMTETQQERKQTICNYILAIADTQQKKAKCDGESLAGNFTLMQLTFLEFSLATGLIQACWNYMCDYPFAESPHPAIRLVRRADMSLQSIDVDGDLTPYLPSAGEESRYLEAPERRPGGLAGELIH